MTVTDEQAFLGAILRHPDDDTPRLVFADWLDERGAGDDPARAALIRAQCRLETLPEGKERKAAEKETKALLRAHARRWTAPLRGASLGENWTFRRGFIDGCSISPTRFVNHAELIFRHAPLLRTVRFPYAKGEVDGLAACPFLARLAAVDLQQMCTCGQCPIDVELRALFKSKHASGLSRLGVAFDRIDADMARALVASEPLRRLAALDLSGNPLGEAGVRVLAGAGHFTRLAELALNVTELDAAAVAALGTARLPALTKLSLAGNNLRPGVVRALVAAPLLAQLAELNLSDNRIGEGGAAALAKLPAAAPLTRLDVRRNALSEKAIRALKARFGKGVWV
ncbi:Leucine Rich repeats (2 copies) [Gemmata obscuriglobus]|uniref:TIGR02996 domain-containing protein n=1 Tax=Gemmata obscuriglobus TaxID=114 RepID=A0A2Z3H3X1_9BACT|nr:TIGR02996 domain-containing protein [Gemmata obscuriglobus]AWM40468.1 TIGR02996 domain-containing protein [Gemmata obscuriglobus]QEG26287.1 Leucine Rich repeats (2 copies) [Gemmata obscuriglobus]VTS01150.1 Repeat-companion domain protein OS=Isosphaera pallida (strain ATCC 43644 / DSM 9630 / IS1B) GN=Isop_0537 PE=4 SV=1: LRR_6: LRR_6 [Gemmata obscuriglobus UQM 2246]